MRLCIVQIQVFHKQIHYEIHYFIYVPARHRKNVSNRSVLLTYQLKRCDDVSAWSRTFKLVNKTGQFILDTRQYIFRHLRRFSLIKVAASKLLQRLKDVGLIWVLVVTSLQRVKLVSLTYVSIGASLRCLKLVGFVYVPMRCRKDVTNRSVSFTYQLRRHDDVSTWSKMLRPI